MFTKAKRKESAGQLLREFGAVSELQTPLELYYSGLREISRATESWVEMGVFREQFVA